MNPTGPPVFLPPPRPPRTPQSPAATVWMIVGILVILAIVGAVIRAASTPQCPGGYTYNPSIQLCQASYP